jgi:hypothetical protein
MGLFFMNSEMRALKEFSWEIAAMKVKVMENEQSIAPKEVIKLGTTSAGGHAHRPPGQPEAMSDDSRKMKLVV